MITVVTALIERDGKVLLQRRADYRQFGGLLETPGGKVKEHETPQQALVRELSEELGIVYATVGSLVDRYLFDDYEPPFEVWFFTASLPENQEPKVLEDATDLQWTDLSTVKDWECVPSLQHYIETHVKA